MADEATRASTPRGSPARAVRDPSGVCWSASEYLERLLSSNSARIQNDLIERVAESRRGLEGDIRTRLTEAREAAERALERARERQTQGREAVRSEIERLEALRQQVANLTASR